MARRIASWFARYPRKRSGEVTTVPGPPPSLPLPSSTPHMYLSATLDAAREARHPHSAGGGKWMPPHLIAGEHRLPKNEIAGFVSRRRRWARCYDLAASGSLSRRTKKRERKKDGYSTAFYGRQTSGMRVWGSQSSSQTPPSLDRRLCGSSIRDQPTQKATVKTAFVVSTEEEAVEVEVEVELRRKGRKELEKVRWRWR